MLISVDNLRKRLTESLPDPHFTIVGDVHGDYDSYLNSIKNSHTSLVVGDVVADNDIGKDKDLYLGIRHLDYTKHRFIGGNHEPYNSEISKLVGGDINSNFQYWFKGERRRFTRLIDNYLYNYGTWEIPGCESDWTRKLFYMRGAWSIDHKNRSLGNDLFEEEELTYEQGASAIDHYSKTNPDFVVTHACPQSIQEILPLRYGGGKSLSSRTGEILQQMFEMRSPKIWVFGHYHLSFCRVINGTLFVCLDRCETLNFDKNLDLILE